MIITTAREIDDKAEILKSSMKWRNRKLTFIIGFFAFMATLSFIAPIIQSISDG